MRMVMVPADHATRCEAQTYLIITSRQIRKTILMMASADHPCDTTDQPPMRSHRGITTRRHLRTRATRTSVVNCAMTLTTLVRMSVLHTDHTAMSEARSCATPRMIKKWFGQSWVRPRQGFGDYVRHELVRTGALDDLGKVASGADHGACARVAW